MFFPLIRHKQAHALFINSAKNKLGESWEEMRTDNANIRAPKCPTCTAQGDLLPQVTGLPDLPGCTQRPRGGGATPGEQARGQARRSPPRICAVVGDWRGLIAMPWAGRMASETIVLVFGCFYHSCPHSLLSMEPSWLHRWDAVMGH